MLRALTIVTVISVISCCTCLFGKEEELKISVIDLHRAQLRTRVPGRWRDKDL
ncbi:lipopolysaccharide kinase InaA family protein [Shigella flexneri]